MRETVKVSRVSDLERQISEVRGAYDKFPDFFRMGTFIDTTQMKL